MVGAVIHGWDLRGNMGNGEWAWPAWCDIYGVAMGCAPCGMRFNRCLAAAFFITGAWLSRAAFDLPVNRHPGLRFGSYFIDIYPVNLILSSHGVCRRRAAFRSLSVKKGVIVWTIS